MSNRREQNMKEMVRRLFCRQFVRFLAVLMVFPAMAVLFYVAGGFLAKQTIWYPEDPLYRALHWIEANGSVLLVFGMIVEVPLVAAFYLGKAYRYLSGVLEAAEKIYRSQEEVIALPAELREAEMKLSHIKTAMERSERAAREAEQRKNDLIVYLAHDLKTPLTSVIGYLTLLCDERQISEELREKYLGITLEKAEHLEDLINEFFEITRFNLSSLTLEKSRVNLTRILQQISYEFKPMFDEKNLTCRLNVPEELYVEFDVGKMQRVFDNLLRNAVNYSFEEKEIVITVRKEQVLQIEFMNYGNPIPEEKLGRIFEQFYRLDTARTSKSGGAGIGLAVAKEIVELHGGKIAADCKDGAIRFLIALPV